MAAGRARENKYSYAMIAFRWWGGTQMLADAIRFHSSLAPCSLE
jgi:hypothetical protein